MCDKTRRWITSISVISTPRRSPTATYTAGSQRPRTLLRVEQQLHSHARARCGMTLSPPTRCQDLAFPVPTDLILCSLDPISTPALYISLGSRVTPSHQTRLSATHAKACIIIRTTDAIQIRPGPTRPSAPTPRRLVPSPNDPWSFCSMTTTTTESNNQSTHYHLTGPNGLSPGTSVGAIIRQ